MKNYKIYLTILFSAFVFASCTVLGDEPSIDSDTSDQVVGSSYGYPWPVDYLFEAPEFEVIESDQTDMVSIYYKSLPFFGVKRNVYAYLCTPEILNGKSYPTGETNLPAIVYAHGGGGKADDDLCRIWAAKGYAVIAMNHFGGDSNTSDGGSAGNTTIPDGFYTTYVNGGGYTGVCEDQTKDWFYNGISDFILAHSLIRSLPEVDSTRTAATGVSWGGIITSLASGLDYRFKAVVPVYGCGFLHETGSMASQILANHSDAYRRWSEEYDPALFVGTNNTPVLAINGTNDSHFFVDQWEKTFIQHSSVRRSMRVELSHGNTGYTVMEGQTFIENILGTDTSVPIVNFVGTKYDNKVLSTTLTNTPDSYRAYLVYNKSLTISNTEQIKDIITNEQGEEEEVYTSATNPWYMTEVFANENHELAIPIDADMTQFYISVAYCDKDDDSFEDSPNNTRQKLNHFSSEVYIRDDTEGFYYNFNYENGEVDYNPI